jgi:hypothetical protein
MSLTDLIIFLLIIFGTVYGVFRGIRPALFLFITSMGSLLAVLLLTVPLENLILNISGIGADRYPDAPAVAVLILEGQSGNAYLASFIPGILAVFFFLALVVGGLLLKPFFGNASTTVLSRILGAFCGLGAGLTAGLLVILQLTRLPWPAAGAMFRGSLLISFMNLFLPHLVPVRSGGL